MKAYAQELNEVDYSYSYELRGNAYNKLNELDGYFDHLEAFSATMVDNLKKDYYEPGDDFLISPLSIFFAFSLQYECLNDTEKTLVRDFFNMSDSEIKATKFLFEYLVLDRDESIFSIFNSLWTNSDSNLNYNKEVLDLLGEYYHANVIEAPFTKKNKEANKALKAYVKEKTNKLIDLNLDVPQDVAFLLVNVLYIKDNWGIDDLQTIEKTFNKSDNTQVKTKFNIGNYNIGRVLKGKNYKSARSISNAGFNLSFILPDEGYDIKDVFNKETIMYVSGYDYYSNYIDEENNIKYSSRVIFPSFDVSSSLNIVESIKNNYSIDSLFQAYKSKLVTNQNVYISDIIHQTRLKADKTGFEGAAVTIIMDKATSALDPYDYVFEELVIDRPFGIILSTSDGIIIFAGIVNNVK